MLERIQKIENNNILRSLTYLMQEAVNDFFNEIEIKENTQICDYLEKLKNGKNVQLPESFPKIAHIYLVKQVYSKNWDPMIKFQFQLKNKKHTVSNFSPGHFKKFQEKDAPQKISFFTELDPNQESVSKNTLIINDAYAYENMQIKDVPKILDQKLTNGTQAHIAYLYTIYERARHSCVIVSAILVDHFVNVGVLDFHTHVLRCPMPYGIMNMSGACSQRRIRENRIKNVIKILFGFDHKGNAINLDERLMFRTNYSLERLMQYLNTWLDSCKNISESEIEEQFYPNDVYSPFNLKNIEVKNTLNNIIVDFDSTASINLKKEFIRLLAVEYFLYGDNQSCLDGLKPIKLHKDDTQLTLSDSVKMLENSIRKLI